MKHILILLTMAMTTLIAMAQPQFSSSGIETYPGEECSLSFHLENEDVALTSFQFDLGLPEGVTLGGMELSDRFQSSHTIASSRIVGGEVRILVYSSQNESITGSNGLAVIAHLSVAKSVVPADYAINVCNIKMSSLDGMAYSQDSFAIDFKVNKFVQEITWVQEFEDVKVGQTLSLYASASSKLPITYTIVSGSEYATLSGNTIKCQAAGEIEVEAVQDGNAYYASAEPVIKKIQIHAQVIPGGDEEPIFECPRLSVAIPLLKPDESSVISFALNNEGPISSFQFDIEANGLYELGMPVLSDRFTNSHILSVGEVEKEATRILVYSTRNDSILGHEGVILSMPVSLNTMAEGATSGLNISNICFSTPGGTQYRQDAVGVVPEVQKYSQHISWEPSQKSFFVGQSIILDAKASSGMAVVYEILEGENCAVIEGGSLVAKAPGIVKIQASQPGNALYEAAQPIAVTFEIRQFLEAYAFEADDVKLSKGDEQTFGIGIVNATPFTSFQFDLSVPEGIEIEEIAVADRCSGHVVSTSTLANGDTRIVAYSMKNADVDGADGDVVNVTLKCISELSAENRTLKVHNGIIVDKNGKTIKLSDLEQEIMSSVAPGDANGDGKVTMADVALTIDYFLNKAPAKFVIEAADVNGDGKITMSDVAGIIDIFLSKK